MPMTWTPEVEAKLMAQLLQICDVKPTGAQLALLAEAMGPECTPKAITHRLAKYRQLSGGVNGQKGEKGGKVVKTRVAATMTLKGKGKGKDGKGGGEKDDDEVEDEVRVEGRKKGVKREEGEGEDEDGNGSPF